MQPRRTHSCVPCWHSCQYVFPAKGTRRDESRHGRHEMAMVSAGGPCIPEKLIVVFRNLAPVDATPDRGDDSRFGLSTGPSGDGCGKHLIDPHPFGSTNKCPRHDGLRMLPFL